MSLESELIAKLVELAKENSAQDARIQNYEYGEMQRYNNQDGARLKDGQVLLRALKELRTLILAEVPRDKVLMLIDSTVSATIATEKFSSDLEE